MCDACKLLATALMQSTHKTIGMVILELDEESIGEWAREEREKVDSQTMRGKEKIGPGNDRLFKALDGAAESAMHIIDAIEASSRAANVGFLPEDSNILKEALNV